MAEVVVRRLRMSASQPQVAMRLEDALRTSAKPATLLHRHVLVRRMRLQMPAAASAESLARQLERAWQEIEARARPLDEASEADNVVWAPSEATARAALVARWTRGESPSAWFWRRLAEPAGEGPWPQRVLRLMLASSRARVAPGQVAEPVPVGPALAVLEVHLALQQFIAALAPDEARALHEVLVGRVSSSSAQLGQGGFRSASGIALVGVEARAMALLDEGLQLRVERPIGVGKTPGDSRREDAVPAGEAEPTGAVAPVNAAGTSDSLASAGATASDPLCLSLPTPAAPAVPAAPQAIVGTVTRWAGLWLLLPILLREGIDGEEAPMVAFADALHAALARFGIAADDAVQQSVNALGQPRRRSSSPWLRLARKAAARDARLPLLRVARRSGQLHLSDARIDVVFPPKAVDVRLRRAGFDLDPGFVPWLGRIVRFHYT